MQKKYKLSLWVYVFHGFLLFYGIGIITLPIMILKRENEYIQVGNKFLIEKVGIINKITLETNLKRIDSVNVKRSIFYPLFNYGTIVITSGSSVHRFRYLESPFKLKEEIESRI